MKFNWSIFRVVTVATCGALGLGAAYGQSTNSGDISGTVTDTTGARIPGAKVTVLNDDTGVTKEFQSDDDGVYDTNSIVPGHYTLTFTKDGFSKYVRGPITVQVGRTGVNAPLAIGSTSQQVTVNTDVPLLDTEGGSQTTTLTAKDMDQLPNVGGANGPDWQNFMILLPGATGTPGSSAGSTNPGEEVSTNGNLPYANVLADGASTSLPGSQNANPAAFEDVEELQVNLSSFSAQYGIGGLIINQITKGGTDKFHGSLYEYFQNTALDAAVYGFGQKVAVPYLNYDDFGGTVSGPVKLPFWNLQKKAFFFFGYDQIHDNAVSSGFQTVPTQAIMSGNFAGSYTLYDPTTQTIAYDTKGNPYPVRQSFMSEYGSNAIPTAMIDNVSNAFQQYYPTPTNHIPYGHFVADATTNGAGVLADNFYSQYPVPRPWKRYFGRLDYDITPHNRLTISDTQGDNGQPSDNAVSACPIGCQSGDVDNNNAQVSDVWNISQNVVNEARMGYTDQLNFFGDEGLGLGIPAKLGWQFSKANQLPSVQFQRNYPYAWINPSANAEYKEFVFDPSDVVTMIKGKHLLHFGGEFAFYRDDATNWGNINAGTLQFTGAYTENWTVDPSTGVAKPNTQSGEEYADFLLGYAQNWSASYTPEFGARLKKPQMFVQDDWKIRENLTINLGVRYEISHGFNEVKGNEATFDPTVVNPATGTDGAFWYGETHANGRNALQQTVYSTVLPRAGFSWLMDPTTTIRGGFGLYSYNYSLDQYGSGMGGSVESAGSYNDQSNGIYPTTKFNGPGTLFPLGGGAVAPLPYSSGSTDPARFNGQSVGYNDYHTPIPKIYQWNLSADKALSTNMVLNLSYVASHGFNLAFPTNLNAVPENQLSSGDTSGCGSGSTVHCAVQFPIYQSINGNLYNAISNYNSLQVAITRRFSNGLSFSANYVWSHFLDDQDSSGWGSREGPQNVQHYSTLTVNQASKNYGPSNFDVRNVAKGYFVYDLPFGKGRKFLNKNFIEDATIGGWQLSGTVVLSGGNPFQLFATSPTYNNGGSQYPDLTGVSNIPRGGRTIKEWYNPAAYADPGPGNFGTVGRNPIVGPGYHTENLSALKQFALPWYDMVFQLRVDAQNVLNHPIFGAPDGSLQNPSSAGNAPGTPYQGDTNSVSQGQITSLAGVARQVQIGARLQF
ncbi:MAG: carboxypeptidase regulatory-like domain-containing protein [Acidobacteria bacterium]|nr:carboxypeptidase regulatory-like domain-containing protein [Acidobacteriota bacterium]